MGLAHALAAARSGKRVLVLDREAQANGASIRNFGFVTVTGQQRGKVWELARRSAGIWREIAPAAGITIEQEGLLLAAQRPEAAAVLEAFAATEMGEGCELLTAEQARAHNPALRGDLSGALLSSADLRVESRTAIPLLAHWLQQAHGVEILRGCAVGMIETGCVRLSDGRTFGGPRIIACPGDDGATLFPTYCANERITRCQLQMLRLAAPGWRLPNPVMSDLSMVRYLGYSDLEQADALRHRLQSEAREELAHGIHLIVVQSADGSLVVGDSHAYGDTPEPFSSSAIDNLMLRQFAQLLGPAPAVIERWVGTYASGPEHSIVHEPMAGVQLVIVTSGTGASTSFALAEDVISRMFN